MVKDSHTGKVGGHVVSSAAYVYYYVNSHVVLSVVAHASCQFYIWCSSFSISVLNRKQHDQELSFQHSKSLLNLNQYS